MKKRTSQNLKVKVKVKVKVGAELDRFRFSLGRKMPSLWKSVIKVGITRWRATAA